ncbi:radical SAM protein [bacterium]|nr:radical SAM protein [bacterium]
MIESIQGIFFVINYYVYYRIGKNASSIRELNIELVSYCNLRCVMCSLDHEKPKQRMAPETLNKILSNIHTDRRFKSLEVINLHNAGEALLHPEIISMLEIISKYKKNAVQNQKPFPKVFLLTNGIPLSKEKAASILELNVIDKMRFSMDGGTPAKFEAMRTRAKWEVFSNNIKTFISLNNQSNGRRIRTEIISVIEPDRSLHTHWMDEDFKKILSSVDEYELRHPHDWAGEVDIKLNRKKDKPHKIGCGLLMHQLVVLPNGDVTVCCADLNSRGVVGNILEKDLFSIYRSKKRLEWIKSHLKKKKNTIDLCKDCETH